MSRKTKKDKVKVTPTYYIGDFNTQAQLLQQKFGIAKVLQLGALEDKYSEEVLKIKKQEVEIRLDNMLQHALYLCAKRVGKKLNLESKYLGNGALRKTN